MQTASSLDGLSNFYQISVKLLGRSPVQAQVLAALITLGIAWYLSRTLLALLASLYHRWMRRRLATDVQAEEPVGAQPAQPPGNAAAEVLSRLPANLRIVHVVARVVQQIVFPSISIALFAGLAWLFGQLGWVRGLLLDIQRLLFLFLTYRLLVGVLYGLFDEQRVRNFHLRVLAPAFWLFIFLVVLQRFVDLNTLAEVRILPAIADSLTLGSLFVATVGFYFWITITGSMQEFLQVILSNRFKVNPGTAEASLILWRYGTIALGLFLVFQLLGFDITTVAIITGGLSIGVGLALQDVFKNFFGGLVLLFEGSVRTGDWVEIGGKEGEVQQLSIRSTVVRTSDNIELIVPNQNWLSSTVTTYTRTNRRVRTRLAVGVSYDSDVRQVMQILVEAAAQHPQVLADPPPSAALVEFAPSSINFQLLVWVDDALLKGRVMGELRLIVWDALAVHHIKIPLPQQEVLLRTSPRSDLIDAPSS